MDVSVKWVSHTVHRGKAGWCGHTMPPPALPLTVSHGAHSSQKRKTKKVREKKEERKEKRDVRHD